MRRGGEGQHMYIVRIEEGITVRRGYIIFVRVLCEIKKNYKLLFLVQYVHVQMCPSQCL